MEFYPRDGDHIGGFKVGRWRCLKQDVLLPGDKIRPAMRGFVRLSALREQLLMPLNAKLFITVAPMRWYEPNIVEMVKDPNSVLTFTDSANGTLTWDSLGLGFLSETPPRFFHRNWMSVYNWHLKWPEDTERGVDTLPLNDSERLYGPQAVNLESLQTRMLDADLLTATDYEYETEASGAREKFDIRLLSQFQAKFRDLREREWLANDRYNEALKDIYNAIGDRGETEQIPIVLDTIQQTLQAEEVWATDAGNLGSQAGVMQGSIEYEMDYEFPAPEHCIISYWMTLRLPPIYARGHSPWLNHDSWTWPERVGDPNQLANMPPQQRQARYYVGNSVANVGFEPAGQMYRAGWGSVDALLLNRGTYLMFNDLPTTAAQLRYHPDVTHAFIGQITGDGLFSIGIAHNGMSNIGLPMASVMAGA